MRLNMLTAIIRPNLAGANRLRTIRRTGGVCNEADAESKEERKSASQKKHWILHNFVIEMTERMPFVRARVFHSSPEASDGSVM